MHTPNPNALPWTLYVYETTLVFGLPYYSDGRSPIDSLTFDPRDWVDTCTNQTPVDTPPDDRLNWRFGDYAFAIYAGEEDSDVLLHVYFVDDESNGHWLLSISREEAEYYANNPPATVTQLLRYQSISVFALTSGEIQLNMYSPLDGKTYIMVFSSTGEITNSYVLYGVYLDL